MIYDNNNTFEALFDNNPEEKEIYYYFEEEQEPLSTEKEKENILNTNIRDEKPKITTIESPNTSFSTNKIDKIT